MTNSTTLSAQPSVKLRTEKHKQSIAKSPTIPITMPKLSGLNKLCQKDVNLFLQKYPKLKTIKDIKILLFPVMLQVYTTKIGKAREQLELLRGDTTKK